MAATGSIIFKVYTSAAEIPVEGATVVVRSQEDPGRLFGVLKTDSSGQTKPLEIETEDAALSQSPESFVKPWTGIIVRIEHPEFERVTLYGVQVFPGITTLQQVQLIPLRAVDPEKNGETQVEFTPQSLWEGY